MPCRGARVGGDSFAGGCGASAGSIAGRTASSLPQPNASQTGIENRASQRVERIRHASRAADSEVPEYQHAREGAGWPVARSLNPVVGAKSQLSGLTFWLDSPAKVPTHFPTAKKCSIGALRMLRKFKRLMVSHGRGVATRPSAAAS